jgi:hypothetical protein
MSGAERFLAYAKDPEAPLLSQREFDGRAGLGFCLLSCFLDLMKVRIAPVAVATDC